MKIREYLSQNERLPADLEALAKKIGVHPSTIYRWLEDEAEGRTPQITIENAAALVNETDGAIGFADVMPVRRRRGDKKKAAG